MHADLSFFSLITNASVVVQLVMLLLLSVSVMSWTMIFRKRGALGEARAEAEQFEDRFWSGGDLAMLYKQLSPRASELGGMANIFVSGFTEFTRLRQRSNSDPMAVVEGAQRSMRVALSREMDELETHLSFLATVFRGLGNVHQATLAMVAPGIAEALIATAMGLFAAIPAVIAYNRYSNDVERLETRYDNFLEEFSSILHRQAHD